MKNENQNQQIINLRESSEIKFYRVVEAANLISISVSHMWTLIREEIIPVYKISEKITLVKAQELLDYVESFKGGIDGK